MPVGKERFGNILALVGDTLYFLTQKGLFSVNLTATVLESVPVYLNSISANPGFIKLDSGLLYGATEGDELQVFRFNLSSKKCLASEIQRGYYPIGFDTHNGIVAVLCFSRLSNSEQETSLLLYNRDLELVSSLLVSSGKDAFKTGTVRLFRPQCTRASSYFLRAVCSDGTTSWQRCIDIPESNMTVDHSLTVRPAIGDSI